MNYYHLKALINATKSRLALTSPTESFFVVAERPKPYIEPSFTKVLYETERPAVILVSAVGVTGKTTLAKALSHDIGLPLLDLAKHKPVGDNTLTGLLHNTFQIDDLPAVFKGINDGTYGVIIDAIDEGRSKTTEKGFEAFLDDIARLCAHSRNASFVLLGRTMALEDCWLYLTKRDTGTGLITISPFDLASARTYIDAFTGAPLGRYQEQYKQVRDHILQVLGTAFAGEPAAREKDFLSFIGYPPVLDAIGTLLSQEKDYHKLFDELRGQGSEDVEITLLNRIAHYILRREKEQKVEVNILKPLVAGAPSPEREQIIRQAFEPEEQCMRLVSFCLHRNLNLKRIHNASINEKYEAHLLSWLPEHPFLNSREFRNAVFESVALATLMASPDPQCVELALDYVQLHKYSYHLIYLLSTIAPTKYVPIEYLHVLIGSALEFWSRTASVELAVVGPDVAEMEEAPTPDTTVDIEIEIVMGRQGATSKSFVFHSKLSNSGTVNLGNRLSAAYVSLPCEAVLSGTQELLLVPPVQVSAKRIRLQSKTLVLRPNPGEPSEPQVSLEADKIDSMLESIVTNAVPLRFNVVDMAGLTYPTIRYAEKRLPLPSDRLLREKYLRLKRILMEFRSHSRGALARHKDKIDSERVLRNDLGHAILRRLLADGILTLSGDRYFLQPDAMGRHLAISWPDLERGRTTPSLLDYLKPII